MTPQALRLISARALIPVLLASFLLTTITAMPTSAQVLEARVDRYLEPYLQTGNFSGSVLIARKGKILLAKGYGLASRDDKVANTPETVFHLASVSRIFTSAAILLLEQQGRLSVEDRLSKYLPEWPRGDEITIHDLLTLSAGLPNINTLPGYHRWQQAPQTPETLAETFRDLPLDFDPGTRSVHSNSNYVVLALLIEAVSGRSYGAFLEQEIFAPLGMNQTAHHGEAGRIIPQSATGYAPAGLADVTTAPAIDWSVKTGHGSIYATVEDLYRFDRALVNQTLLGQEAVNKLFTEHFPRNGYGWFIGERGGAQRVYINGRSPGFGSYWARSVGEDVTVIVLGNLYNSVPNSIGSDLLAMVLGEPYEAPSIRFDPPEPALLAEVAGSYQFGPDFYRPNGTVTFHVQKGHLFNGIDWVMPTRKGALHFIHRRYWSDLEFRRDESGQVVELLYDSYVGKKK